MNELVSYLLKDRRECGHTDVVQVLLEDDRVNPGGDNNSAIKLACAKGHKEIVRLLLDDHRVDPGVDCNYPIQFPKPKKSTRERVPDYCVGSMWKN
jgi:hypothetical protein